MLSVKDGRKLFYLAPKTGYYQVASYAYKSVPTGRRVKEKNYGRRWWQLWKPKMIEVDEYKIVAVSNGKSRTVLAFEGDQIELGAEYLMPWIPSAPIPWVGKEEG